MRRLFNNAVFVLSDLLLLNLAFLIALWLRFDGHIPDFYIESSLKLAPVFSITMIASFFLFRLYNRLWQYASTGELISIVLAISVSMLVNVSYAYLQMQGDGNFPIPRSVVAIYWIFSILFIGATRFSWRLLSRQRFIPTRKPSGRKTLIVGAGDAGATVARELNNHNGHSSVPLGFIDDDYSKQKMRMYGLPVLGGRDEIPELVERYGIDEIIIAIPSASGKVIRELVDICQATPASLKILPGLYELIDGRVTVNQIREVKVDDLLGREPVEVDLESIAGYLTGKVVLVTGAGGSIGAEICRQVARFNPRQLILLGHGENSIYDIFQELSLHFRPLCAVPVIADVKDKTALNAVFSQYRPQVVFHAAAHKHVPLMEEYPAEAVKNNIMGTLNTCRAASRNATEVFILISSDKAVNPAGIMGATKRVAEMVVQLAAKDSVTRFAAVRFGNVLDSRGSVVPLFKKQIENGGPVTVTQPEMVRYFMTIPEASQLVIQAGALAANGEIFILDMGEPMNILSLARRMIKLAGLEPDKDIEIVFTGARPGEKLYEEILTSEEGVKVTIHQRIFTARPDRLNVKSLERLLQVITEPHWRENKEGVVTLLQTVLPDFRPGVDDSLTEDYRLSVSSPG